MQKRCLCLYSIVTLSDCKEFKGRCGLFTCEPEGVTEADNLFSNPSGILGFSHMACANLVFSDLFYMDI